MPTPISRPTFTPNLWRECEQVYAQKPRAYIQLQDNHQINVNLLLLAQYLDEKAYLLTESQWEIMLSTTAQWEESVLQPYRKLRRIAKQHLANDEYQKMLDVELIMERKSQHLLLQRLNSLVGETFNLKHADSSNTQHYLSLLGLNESVMATLT
ncbi:TIGR02444 family protein [Shewanella phaeophyticola]|uniref:TIGR02444 family protein n=1 Tax=Shewanella phaeophyticola TaxID=2978345 RepID=A0ABT2P5Q2_9GAMM|nr:TIGR02444 family protein [Shewanella sp. KJ10-1]MCT8987696.1 TIGR02444 family protein [Shewanella sp. KJ10-1]